MKFLLKTAVIIVFFTAIYLCWQWANNVPEIPKDADIKDKINNEEKKNSVSDKSQTTIKIGLIEPKTGLPAGTDSTMGKVINFAAGRINNSGGINGKKIEILEFDSQNTPLGAKKAAYSAVKENVSAVIGGWYSSNAVAMAEILQNAKIPMIATGASNPNVTKVGEYIFRVNYVDYYLGSAMAEFAYSTLKARRAVTLANVGNIYSPYLVMVFSEQFKQFGGEIIWNGEYLTDKTDYMEFANEIKKQQADIIYLPGYEKESAEIIKACRSAGIKTVFLGSDGWLPEMIKYGGDAVKGGYYVKIWNSEAMQISGLKEEFDAWINQYGKIDKDLTALTFDASFLLFDALKRAKSASPPDVCEAISKTNDFKGIIGPYTFTNSRDPVRPLLILKINGGNPEVIKKVNPKTIKIGVIFAKTGDAGSENIMGFEAARYAADEINYKGGIKGRIIELLEYDNKSSALGSREAAEDAVKDQVSVVIGASWSSHTSAMAPVFQENKIPMISPASTNPQYTKIGEYIFRLCYTDKIQGEAVAEFALSDLGAKTAVVMTNTSSEYSVDLAKYFIDHFNTRGTILKELDYIQEGTDFTSQIEETKSLSPDVIFVPGYNRDAAFIIKQSRQKGIKSTFLGGDGWDDLMFGYASKEFLENSYFSEHWHIDIPDESSRRFVAEYSKTHKMYTNGLVALTYDCVYLIADALRRADSTEPSSIRDAIAATDNFKGITGPVNLVENGETIRNIAILCFKDGKAEFFKMFKPPSSKNK